MALVIMVTKPDNSVAIIYPVIFAGETEAQAVARVQARDVPANAVNVEVVDTADLPPNRRWRNAWRRNGPSSITVPLSDATALRKAEILARRDVLLDVLRKKIDKAQEDGSGAAVILALRNKSKSFRELETTIDTQLASVSDLTSLSDFTPTEFQGVTP